MTMPRLMILVVILGLAACGNRDKEVTLTRIKNTGNGPDEFAIVPGKPLQAPQSYSDLPPPTPGSANLTDQTPKPDAIAALGGDPGAANGSAVAKSDAELVRHAGRYGVTSGIRQVLAAEDAELRRRHGKVNILRLGFVDDYANAYKKQWLDARAESARLRRLGVVTPTAPPEE